MRCINQSFTTRIAHVDGIPLSVPLWQFLHKSTRGRPPPAAVSVGGGRRDGRGAAGLRALQVAGVAEEVAVQRVAAVTLLVVQLHLTALLHRGGTRVRHMHWQATGAWREEWRLIGLISALRWLHFPALTDWTAIMTPKDSLWNRFVSTFTKWFELVMSKSQIWAYWQKRKDKLNTIIIMMWIPRNKKDQHEINVFWNILGIGMKM